MSQEWANSTCNEVDCYSGLDRIALPSKNQFHSLGILLDPKWSSRLREALPSLADIPVANSPEQGSQNCLTWAIHHLQIEFYGRQGQPTACCTSIRRQRPFFFGRLAIRQLLLRKRLQWKSYLLKLYKCVSKLFQRCFN